MAVELVVRNVNAIAEVLAVERDPKGHDGDAVLLGIPLRQACHAVCYDVDSHCSSSPNIVSGSTDISSFPYINTNAPAIIFTSSLQMYPWDPLEEAPSHISIPRVVISSIDSPLSEVERSIAPDCRPAAQDAYPGIYGSHGDHRSLDSYMTRHPIPSRVIYVGKTFLLYLLVERCSIMWLLQIPEGGASMSSTLLKQYWWIVLLIAVGLLVLQSIKGSRSKGVLSEKSEDLPYVLKRYLMSKAERSFFGVLEQVTDSSKYHIFPQVSLGNLVDVEKGTRPYQTHRNRVDLSLIHISEPTRLG